MQDTTIADLIAGEQQRQRNGLELIPSENYVSKQVLQALGSELTNKYSEGYPGRRYYGGQEFTDQVEQLAIDRAKLLFGADHANVQPHSGAPANEAVYSMARAWRHSTCNGSLAWRALDARCGSDAQCAAV